MNQTIDTIFDPNEDTKVWGVQTIMAITLIPWISFAIGNLYPVWVWLASDFSSTYWLETALLARSGIVQHYGMCLMAMLSHNWFKTMTYRVDDTSLLSSNVFHDLTLGAFETKRTYELNNEQKHESAFHDLTFGAFEKKNDNKSSSSSTARNDEDDYYY